ALPRCGLRRAPRPGVRDAGAGRRPGAARALSGADGGLVGAAVAGALYGHFRSEPAVLVGGRLAALWRGLRARQLLGLREVQATGARSRRERRAAGSLGQRTGLDRTDAAG